MWYLKICLKHLEDPMLEKFELIHNKIGLFMAAIIDYE